MTLLKRSVQGTRSLPGQSGNEYEAFIGNTPAGLKAKNAV